jgi:hypothetical protein
VSLYVGDPAKWPAVAEWLRTAGERDGFGYDTETYGQPDKTSPQHRARIHCWSVGVLTETRSPRGFRRAVGRVLPVEALSFGPIREVLEDARYAKYAHNSPHDYHSTRNAGVEIAGLVDTLQWLRVAVPGMREYGLKAAEQWALGYPSRPEFRDMRVYEAVEVHARRRKERGCICGKTPCRAKQASDWLDADGVWRPHLRVEWKVFTPEQRTVRRRLEVPEFVPGAQLPPLSWLPPERPKKGQVVRPPSWWRGKALDRWEQWEHYTVADAVHGIELKDWLCNLKHKELSYPWQPRLAA